MASELKEFAVSTGKDICILDITESVEKAVQSSKIGSGVAVVSVSGSTAAISTMEFEPGLLKDVPRVLEKIAPLDFDWVHHQTWNDRNGASHVLSTIIGTSQSIPFEKKRLLLGTWQQVVLLDFDRPARTREIQVQIVG